MSYEGKTLVEYANDTNEKFYCSDKKVIDSSLVNDLVSDWSKCNR